MSIFYVSPTGNDNATGRTTGTAFATLERAQLAMRQSAGEDTTLVRGGTYDQRDTLVLTSADNGSHFAAYGTEAPVLSGGTALTNWTQGANGIWTAALNQADLHQLTVDGVRQTEARFPNAVPADPVKGGWLWANDPPAGIDPRQQLAVDPADITASGLAVGMKIHLFTNASWSSNTLTVTAVNAATGVVSFDHPADFELGAATRYYVEDGLVQLDQPGEWYFDPNTQLVHFKAPPGFDGTGVVASGDASIIRITDAQNIGVQGFTFSDMATGAHNADFSEAGISVVRSTDVTIAANQFFNLAQGVNISDQSSNITVTNNDFEHLWASAILADYGTSGNTITGNDIRWTNEVFVFHGAIALPESRDNYVAHNLIRDVPRFGISGGNYTEDNLSGGNIMEYNTILRSMQQTSDGGAIYTWSGPDLTHLGDIVRYNRIIDAGGLETQAGGFRPGQEYSNGIYLDDLTSRWQVYGNLIEGTVRGGIYLHGGSFNAVHDNIVLGNQDIGIQFYAVNGQQMVGNDVFNNIVEGTTDPNGQMIELQPAFVAPGTLHDNFYWNPRNQTLTFSYDTFAQVQAAGYDLGSLIFSGALFADPLTGNWTLRSGTAPLLGGFNPLPLAEMGQFGTGRIILGSVGNDRLAGTVGDDVLDGHNGADRLLGGAGRDDMTGGRGADSLSGQAGNDLIHGGADRDVLYGGTEADRLFGDGQADYLFGDAGNDRLDGGLGNDVLKGGAGADTLTGGLGADLFYFGVAAESGVGWPARDRIEDFQKGIDKINLRAIDANPRDQMDTAFRFTAGPVFDGQPGSLRVVISGGDTLILADINGDRVADFAIQLEGVHQLSASDFFL